MIWRSGSPWERPWMLPKYFHYHCFLLWKRPGPVCGGWEVGAEAGKRESESKERIRTLRFTGFVALSFFAWCLPPSYKYVDGQTMAMVLFPTEPGSSELTHSLSLSPGTEKLEINSSSSICRSKLFHASLWLYFSPMPTKYLQRRAVYFNKILLLLELWPDFVSIFWSRKDSSGMKLATHSASVLIVWEFLAGEKSPSTTQNLFFI